MVNTAKRFLIVLSNLQQIHLKNVSKRAIQKTAQATGDLTGNKFADKITKMSKISQQNNLEKVTIEYNKEIPKERQISLQERQKIVDDLRLI